MPKFKYHGFTIVELMITLVVAAILLTMAVPDMNRLLLKSRLDAKANELRAALNFARSEAIKRGETVQLCSSVNGTACGNTTQWKNGWLITAATQIKSSLYEYGGFKITVSVAGADVTGITYNSSGRLTATAPVIVTVCDNNPVKGFQIDIALTGRASINGDIDCS